MTSQNGQVILIVDANDNTISSGDPSQWQDAANPNWYGGTTRFVQANETTSGASAFKTTFHGTSVAFVGHTSSVGVSCEVGSDTGLQQSQNNLYTQWYQSALLPDDQHTIVCTNPAALVEVDYFLTTAGENTPLSGETIMVDDSAVKEIWYQGLWVPQVNQTFEFGLGLTAHPMQNTTHISRIVGSSLEFHFAGTSVSVYGVVDFIRNSNYTLEFDLDGNITRGVYPSLDELQAHGEVTMMNYMLYHSSQLRADNHTLLINLTAIEGSQGFRLDYITYNPSFTFIGQKPVFARNTSTSTHGTPTSTGIPSWTTTSNGKDPQLRSGLTTGAIVGITVSVVTFMLLFAILVLLRRKRDARKNVKIVNHIEPFTMNIVASEKQIMRKEKATPPTVPLVNPVHQSYGQAQTPDLNSVGIPQRREGEQLTQDQIPPPAYQERYGGPSDM
ncbi:hypothetical protein VNI00_014095 [Paramarasmius palmivorus]|uniref:Peptidase A1 domain-containing protein n=1 Tax=Paramarasmius palmivorus TaxID=297713 RepID=A0AAW0BUQ4_9AGAR